MSIQNSDFSNFKETLEAVQKSNEERKGFIQSIGLGKVSVVAFKNGAFYEKELNLLGRVLHALGFIKETNAKHYKKEVQSLYEKNIEQLPSSPKMSAFFKKVIGKTVPQKPAEQSLLNQTSTNKTSLETSGSNETELEIEKESQEPLEAPKEESQSPKDETLLETSTDPKKAAPEPEKNPEEPLETPQEISKDESLREPKQQPVEDESPTKNESVDVSGIKKETITKPKEETVKAVKNFLIAFSLKIKKKKGRQILFDLAQFKKINSMHDKSLNKSYAKLNLNFIFIKKISSQVFIKRH